VPTFYPSPPVKNVVPTGSSFVSLVPREAIYTVQLLWNPTTQSLGSSPSPLFFCRLVRGPSCGRDLCGHRLPNADAAYGTSFFFSPSFIRTSISFYSLLDSNLIGDYDSFRVHLVFSAPECRELHFFFVSNSRLFPFFLFWCPDHQPSTFSFSHLVPIPPVYFRSLRNVPRGDKILQICFPLLTALPYQPFYFLTFGFNPSELCCHRFMQALCRIFYRLRTLIPRASYSPLPLLSPHYQKDLCAKRELTGLFVVAWTFNLFYSVSFLPSPIYNGFHETHQRPAVDINCSFPCITLFLATFPPPFPPAADECPRLLTFRFCFEIAIRIFLPIGMNSDFRTSCLNPWYIIVCLCSERGLFPVFEILWHQSPPIQPSGFLYPPTRQKPKAARPYRGITLRWKFSSGSRKMGTLGSLDNSCPVSAYALFVPPDSDIFSFLEVGLTPRCRSQTVFSLMLCIPFDFSPETTRHPPFLCWFFFDAGWMKANQS